MEIVQSTSALPVGVICVSQISLLAAEGVIVVDAARRLFGRRFVEAKKAEDGFVMMLWRRKHW